MRRKWTLSGARAMLPEVRERTERAVEAIEVIETESRAGGGSSRKRSQLLIDEIAGRWVREMEALGVEVKGPWLVDFDNGSGYYCWKWPEKHLEYFHGYDEGFAKRIRIQ